MIEGMKNFHMYENFAYHISLLRQFVSIHTRNSRGRGKVSDSDDESQTIGQETTEAVNFPSTGKLVVALLLLIVHKVQCPRAPEFKKREN